MKSNYTLASFLVLLSSSLFAQNWEYVDYNNEAGGDSHFHLTNEDMVMNNWWSSRPIKFYEISTDPNNAYLTQSSYIEDEQYNLGSLFFDRSSDLSTLVVDMEGSTDSAVFFKYNGSEYLPVDTTDFGMFFLSGVLLSSTGDTALVPFGFTSFELFGFDGSNYQNISSYFSGGPDHQTGMIRGITEDFKTLAYTSDFANYIVEAIYQFDGQQWSSLTPLPAGTFSGFRSNNIVEYKENDEIVRYQISGSGFIEVSRRPTIDTEIDDSDFVGNTGISSDRDTYMFTDESGSSPVVKVYEWNGTNYLQRGTDIIPVELDTPILWNIHVEINFEMTPDKKGLMLIIEEQNQGGSTVSSHLEYFVWDENATVSSPELKQESINFSIFPNPAQNNLQVNGLGKDVEYSIYNITGKQMDYGRLMPFNNQINIEALPSGVYFVEVAGTAKKFIKH